MFGFTSVTIGHTNREIRPQSLVRTTRDGAVRTVKVRPGRSNERRTAIDASRYGR